MEKGRYKAYLINLDRAESRLVQCRGELEREGISWERVRGIEGKKVPQWAKVFNERGYITRQGRRRIFGEVGCYLSHLKALKAFLNSNQPYGLILEDDIQLPSGFSALIDDLIALPNEWDMLRLSTVNHGKPVLVKRLDGGRSLGIFLTREKGAGAYLVSRKAASIMIDRFLPMQLPWDHVFDMEWFYGYRTLSVYPYPVTQFGEDTQIQSNIRDYYLPSWKRYWTVFPYRAFVEITRVIYRLSRIIAFKSKTHHADKN